MLRIKDYVLSEEEIMKELKESGSRFGQLDQKLAADMLKKCQDVRNNQKADETHRDVAVQILLENQTAHTATILRMVRGREMIRILMRMLSVRKTFAHGGGGDWGRAPLEIRRRRQPILRQTSPSMKP